MTKHLTAILKKMCSITNAEYTNIDFKREDWFLDHTWTIKQELEFKSWLVKYLKKSAGARKELMNFPTLFTKNHLEKVASFFVLTYGWKYRDA